MMFIRNRGIVAALVAVSCVAVPASASADSLPSTFKSDAAQSGSAASQPSTDRSDAAQSGGDLGNGAGTLYSPVDFKGGDSAQMAPTAVPTTIEVVRPERTIVRDVDDSLSLILSSTALLLVLTGLGVALIRTRMAPRPGHSH